VGRRPLLVHGALDDRHLHRRADLRVPGDCHAPQGPEVTGGRPMLRLTLVALLAAALVGCTPHNPNDDSPVSLNREDADCLVVIAIDLSGSFLDMMAKDGRAYAFTLRVADTYFRSSIGTKNRLVIAQLSATDRALLWDGTPAQLREEFP